jgi:hypothetical protein
MRLATVRQIVAATDTFARALGMESGPLQRSPDARLAVYDLALTAIQLVLAENEQPRAWERIALTIADRRERLSIDALDAEPVDQARRRLSLLATLPDVTGFASHQDIVDLIGDTINIGAPRYNSGDIRGCAALYWMVVGLISETPATRGFPGYARLQGQLKPLADAAASSGVLSFTEADSWAWELRRALDATLLPPTP